MRRFTSFLLTMLLAVIAIPIQAAIQANVVIDEEYSSLAELEGKTFAIVNKETGKALYGTNNQNLGYDILVNAFQSSNTGYYFKLDTPKADAEDETITNFNLLRLTTPAGEEYNIWGEPGYLNSQPATKDVTFILGLNNQNGKDIKNGAVWDIQYVEGKGFTLLNKGTDLYLNDNAPAKYEEPVYWTFCTLKNDWLSAFQPLFDEETTIKAHGTSEEANATYDAKVNPIKANVESGTITDPETDLAIIDAALTELAKAQTTAGAIFTRVIANATINGADGWTIERPVGGNGPLLNGSAFEYWAGNASDRTQASFDYYQVIEGLPYGAYTVSADMYNSLNGEEGAVFSPTSGVYGKSGEYESVKLVDVEGVTLNTYTTGNVLVEDGTIRIGIKSTVIPVAARWFVADNFQLTYNGPVATDEELAPLTAEIANAKLLGVDVTAWEGKTYTASEIDAAVKAIKVAEYNTVIAAYPMNAGTLIPAFDAWEGGMAANIGQHWDGTITSTYYEQAGDEWGKNSWTNSKTTTVTLPKGKYVIYAAGRNSAGGACSSYIKVNETTQIFPANGDTGFGIATDGTATFDPSATYANNNVGRGFEYRFIAFEVTADEGEDKTLTVGGEATAAKQWMSICTPVLLTTSDNSAIAKQVLTSDIAAAQAIVDAKAGVGEGLFLIPEEAFNTFAAAVDAAKTANENPEATTEEINTAIAELAAAKETYKNTPVNAPAADKQYTLSLQTADETPPFELSIATDKISIETAGTPVTFVTQENGTYALSNGTEYVAYQGGNTWSLTASADEYGWTIAAVEGGYTITGKNGFLGTNTKDGAAAGSTCYGNKKATDGFYIWTISEYVTPVEPTTYAITVAEGIENGAITTDVEEAEEGATVTITATPAEGYKLESISVKNGEEDVEVSAENTFVMPAAPVTISATFVEDAVEPDPNLIEIAQTIDDNTPVDGFTNQATKNVTEDYTEYTFKENISLAFKMLNVDVKDCDYVVIKFAEPTPAGLKASFVEGEGNEEIPEGVTEWKNIIADNTTVKDGIIPQITLLTIFGPAGKSVKVEGVYKHKVASEPELATVENMTLTVAEDAVIEDEDKTFPVVFGYKAIVDESISPMASMSVTYKVTTNGEDILSETFAGIDIAKETQNIWIKNMEYGKTYTVTITSVSVSYFDLETFGDNVAYTKTFAEDELTATFTTNAIPVSIDGINAAAKSNRKVVENGRVVIYKNGVKTMSSGVSIR